jgi:hypothetical protein
MTTADTPAPKEAITAALLVIGSRILSGRTKDQNIGYIAEYLTALGMHLVEMRVIGDEETAIVDAVNARSCAPSARSRICWSGSGGLNRAAPDDRVPWADAASAFFGRVRRSGWWVIPREKEWQP